MDAQSIPTALPNGKSNPDTLPAWTIRRTKKGDARALVLNSPLPIEPTTFSTSAFPVSSYATKEVHMDASNTPARLLRLPEVLNRFPVSASKWYLGIKQGIYPPPVKLSHRCAAWPESAINALIERLSSGEAA